MANFDIQINDIKDKLQSSQNILIVLPSEFTTDELSAGLSLFLSLDEMKKECSIVSEGTLHVSDSNLYGVGQVSKTLPPSGGGNFVLTFEGVVASDGTVPALEKLDYFPEGNNLNLVFHIIPGQRFEPAKITPKYQGGSFNLIFVIGASNLNALGGVYTNNSQVFSGIPLVNIDNDSANSRYGAINLIDPESGTLSEMILNLIRYLSIPMDADIASNILSGIYSATSNLTVNAKPGTFMAVGQALQSGGKLIAEGGLPPVPPQEIQPEVSSPSVVQPETPNIPLNQIFGFPVQGGQPSESSESVPVNTPSAEERPTGEQAFSSSPEVQNPDPDWLTPKVYKGGNIG